MSLRQDYFIDPEIRVYQDPEQYCFNTDSFLLAKFVKVRPGEHVLEIGCNNGAILVWLAQYKPGFLTGIEILEDAARLAEMNLESSGFSDWKIINEDIKNLKTDPGLQDAVLCNPPFFEVKESDQIKKGPKELGRFEFNLNVAQAIAAAASLLKSNGRFYLVHRPARLNEIMVELNRHHLNPTRLKPVYDQRTGRCTSVLIEAIKERNQEMTMDWPQIIHQ